MATMTEVAELIGANQVPRFRPSPVYDAHSDSFMLFARNTPSFASRLNSRFTLFLDAENKTLVGFEIKGFSRLLKRMRQLRLFVTNSTVTLQQSVAVAIISSEGEGGEAESDQAIRSITMLLEESDLGGRNIDPESMELCEG